MGLLNARNLRRAKDLLEKNRHKVGDAVEKAGGTLDKVSKGKTSSVTAKATDAAKKYSTSSSANHYGVQKPVDPADVQMHQAEATAGAAKAVQGAADALTNLINKAAVKAEEHNAKGEAPTAEK